MNFQDFEDFGNFGNVDLNRFIGKFGNIDPNRFIRITDLNKSIPYATQIVPGLWLGNQASSQSTAFLHENNISAIVNCSKNIPNSFGNITYYRVPVDDHGPYIDEYAEYNIEKLRKLLPETIKILDYHLGRNESVLVHCHAGAQRSATVVINYLLHRSARGTKYPEVKEFVVKKRPVVYYGGRRNNFEKLFH